jgi:hypothetical protein
MNDKIPSDFSNHDQWLSYVRDNIPVARQSYALACGRTELFKRFYEIRQQTFPVEFAEELKRIGELSDPERTDNLELLNRRILGSLAESAEPIPSLNRSERRRSSPFWTGCRSAR